MGRIVYLSRGGNIGGSQRQLLYLMSGLGASYEPVVVCTADGDTVTQLRSAGVQTEVLPLKPWRKLPGGILRYGDAERLVGAVRRYDPTLVHSSDMWLGNYVAWLKWRLRIPTVVHVRSPLGLWGVHKHRLRAATGLISISKRITRTLTRARIPAGRIAQIEDAVDTDRFRPRDPSADMPCAPEQGGGVVNVGLVGRIEPAKRQMEFVAAACDVAADLPGRARFFIIGETRDAEYFNRLKGLAESRGLDGQLVFTGRRDDMSEVLCSLDVLVSLSGGSVMYEAMSCGLCVLSAGFTMQPDSMHLRDGVTGVVVPAREPGVLADRLKRLIGDPQVRSRLGQAARQRAETHLSHRDMIVETLAFYDRVLCGG
jgi:glycosyltransferase involved in cell wall biosynthesis